jgi:hypothetical protein
VKVNDIVQRFGFRPAFQWFPSIRISLQTVELLLTYSRASRAIISLHSEFSSSHNVFGDNITLSELSVAVLPMHKAQFRSSNSGYIWRELRMAICLSRFASKGASVIAHSRLHQP